MDIKYFLVGGAVRDLLLGKGLHDMDVAFSCSEKALLHRYPEARKAGGCAGTVILDGVQFSPLRGGLREDSVARDLTVNSAVAGHGGRVYAHPMFVDDLCRGVIRVCSNEVFSSDPLRIFRVARFAAVFPEWKISEETLGAMKEFSVSGREVVAALPRERVAGELLKALAAAKPSRFFTTLRDADFLSPWLEELVSASEIPAGPSPWHDNSVLEHTFEVMDRCAGSPLAVWMALCHDLGKIRTDPSMLPHHYGHESKGIELARQLAKRLGLSTLHLKAGTVGTELHMKGGMYGTLRAGTKRDMLFRLDQSGAFHDFWVLAAADGGLDWEAAAERDLAAIRSVRLPDAWRNRGKASGEHLRAMQCELLSRLPKMEPRRA